MDADFLKNFVDGLIKIVRLPPRLLVIAILIGVIAFQYIYRNNEYDKKEKELNNLSSRLDTCRNQSTARDMFWILKIDSIRMTYVEELKEKNRELEQILHEQRMNNKIVKKTLKDLKND